MRIKVPMVCIIQGNVEYIKKEFNSFCNCCEREWKKPDSEILYTNDTFPVSDKCI